MGRGHDLEVPPPRLASFYQADPEWYLPLDRVFHYSDS